MKVVYKTASEVTKDIQDFFLLNFLSRYLCQTFLSFTVLFMDQDFDILHFSMIQPTFWGKNVAISYKFSLLISKCHTVWSDLSAFPCGNLWHGHQGWVYESLCRYSWVPSNICWVVLSIILPSEGSVFLGIHLNNSKNKTNSLLTSLIWAEQGGKYTWVELGAAPVTLLLPAFPFWSKRLFSISSY